MEAAIPDPVEVVRADLCDKPVIRRLLELDAHDHSEFDPREINDHGEFGYPYLDHYWTEPNRYPFLIRSGGHIAGFAFVGLLPAHEDAAGVASAETFSMAEFFVLRAHRRRGIGRRAARDLFRRFPGRWKVRQQPGNEPATSFWTAVMPSPFTEKITDDGITQYFTSRVESGEQ